MSESLKDLTINIVAFLMTATAAIAIKYAVPELGDRYVQVAAGLVALLIVFLVWWSAWRPREDDLRVRRAHERASQLIAEEQEFLTKQLESVKAELSELERKIAKQPSVAEELTEVIRAKRDELKDLMTRLSFLKGEPVTGPQGLVFPSDAARALLHIASQSIPADTIGVPLGALIWALIAEFVGGALGISAGLLIGIESLLLFVRFIAPEYYSQSLKQSAPRLPLPVHMFLVTAPVSLFIYFILQLLYTSQGFQANLPYVVNWVGLAVAIIFIGIAWAGLVFSPPPESIREWAKGILISAVWVIMMGGYALCIAASLYLVVLVIITGDFSFFQRAWAELNAFAALRPGLIDQILFLFQLFSGELGKAFPQARIISAVILPLVVLIPNALSSLTKLSKARNKIAAIEEAVQLVSIYSPLSCTPSLRGLQLSTVNLTGWNLRVNLAGWNLEGADLSGSDLTGALLDEANLYKARLQGAILKKASLKKADLRYANLRKADLEEADLTWAILACADLSDANLKWARLWGAHLFRVKFAGADVKGAQVSERHWVWPQSLPINPRATLITPFPVGDLNCKKEPLTDSEWAELENTAGGRRFKIPGFDEMLTKRGDRFVSYPHEPNGIILYAERMSSFGLYGDGERWKLCGLPLDSKENQQPEVLLENITDCRSIKVSKDRTAATAVVRENERNAIYILRAKDGWKPVKIVDDCRQWLEGDLYLADDGTAVGTSGFVGPVSILLEEEGWKRRVIGSDSTGFYRIWDNGRTITQGRDAIIVVWDIWHDWEPYIINPVPSKIAREARRLDIQFNYKIGGEARVAMAAGYVGRGKHRDKHLLFLAERVLGKYSSKVIWESPDEIKAHAVAPSNDCAIFSIVDKKLAECSVYGIRRETGWKPELIITAGRYVGQVVDNSLDGDLFVLAIQEQPYAIYAIRLRDGNWESYRLFSDVTSDVGARPISAIVAPDRRHVAGLSVSSDTRERVLCCVTPEGKTIGQWPIGEYLIARGARIEFSPDGQWLSYLVEIDSDGGRQLSRMIRRIDGSGERELYSFIYYPTEGRAYIGWVVSGVQS